MEYATVTLRANVFFSQTHPSGSDAVAVVPIELKFCEYVPPGEMLTCPQTQQKNPRVKRSEDMRVIMFWEMMNRLKFGVEIWECIRYNNFSAKFN